MHLTSHNIASGSDDQSFSFMPAAPGEEQPGGSRRRKLGEVIAQKILSEIIERGWQAGEVLGTERELLVRYGISRATLREAIRQIERHGAAEMRRGAGGGLVVSAPAQGAVERAMSSFFELTRVSLAEQHEVREHLERTAVHLASERCDETAADALQSVLAKFDAEPRFEALITANMEAPVAIAELTGNPSLALFIQTLNTVTHDIQDYLRREPALLSLHWDFSKQFHKELVAAILRRDADEAERLVASEAQRRLLAMATIATSQPDPEMKSPVRNSGNGDPKLAESVALAIINDIETANWEVGYNIGKEATLQERYSVSRATLREAIRQVELHGIVRVKSGVGGGIIIDRVDTTYTEEVVGTYLDSSGVLPSHLWETQSVLEVLSAERLAALANEADCEALHSALDRIRGASPENFLFLASMLHAEIANRAGNRVLALYIRILLRYGLRALPPVVESRMPWLVVMHERLVDAICTHDRGSAERAMTLMFEKSRGWVGLRMREH